MTKKGKPRAGAAGKAPRPSLKRLSSKFLLALAAQALVDAPNYPEQPVISKLDQAKNYLHSDGLQKLETFTSLLSSARDYFLTNSYRVSQNTIRHQIKKIFSLANLPIDVPTDVKLHQRTVERKYRQLCDYLQNEVSAETLALLTQRLTGRANLAVSENFDGLIDRGTLLPATPSADRKTYCNAVASLTVIERAYETLPQTDDDGRLDIVRRKPGRNRPNGKPSRPTPKVTFYAPPAEENPRWLSQVRVLEAQFAVVWHQLTNNSAQDEKHYRTFVASLLEEILDSSEGVDVDVLVRIGREGANLSGADSATRR